MGFNIFRISADLLHLASFVFLLLKMRKQKSCNGISLKTQVLYAVVFTTRYLDLFPALWGIVTLDSHYLTLMTFYNSTLKILFLGLTYYIVYLMLKDLKQTYDKQHDTFKIYFLVGPAALLALLINHEFSFLEILWTFSIYLEAVAIMPQLFLLQRTGEADALSSHYIFTLGGYRGLYLINWIYRYFTEDDYAQYIVWISGLIQTALYCDFFYYYATKIMKGQNTLKLPGGYV